MRHTSVQKIKIQMSDLQLGMYVCELDRPWTESSFLFQGFLLDNPKDYELLINTCQYVYIDVSKSKLLPKMEFENTGQFIAYHNKKEITPFQVEIEYAIRLYDKADEVIHNLFRDAAHGHIENVGEAKELIAATAASILRNPNALEMMTRLKDKDKYTAQHSVNVSILSMRLAQQVGLEYDRMQHIGLCGLLHDVGKMRTQDKVLKKPGRLTAKEMEEMKDHARLGYEILSNVRDLDKSVAEVAYSHHERLLGQGYPRGLQDEAISFESKLVAIADVYDAITSKRVYCDAIEPSTAMEYLYSMRAKAYDEKLVESFIQCIGIYPVGTLVELSSGEVALVLSSTPSHRLEPLIMLVRDAKKNPLASVRIINLTTFREKDGRPYNIVKSIPDGSYGVRCTRFR